MLLASLLASLLAVAFSSQLTEYDVWYPLQHSSLSRLKDERGFIRLRLKLDWLGNDRQVVTGYLKPQENLFFSVETHKMWKCCLCCIMGKDIGNDYDWKIFLTYYNEIKGYINLFSKPLERWVIDTCFWVKPLRR